MAHVENERPEVSCMKQTEILLREAVLMAERLALEARARAKEQGVEVKDEAYLALIPLLSERVIHHAFNVAHMTRETSPKEIDAIYESVESVIVALRSLNRREDK